MHRIRVLLLVLLVLPAGAAAAELALPLVSPAAAVKTVIGKTEVEIEYHRPGVKGRKIWGGLVAYGEVWRLGAGEATTIRLSTPAKIEGHEVPAGTYALFAIPGPDQWTFALSKNARQWGAYGYKQQEDLLRIDVKPRTGPFTEWLLFTITPLGRGKGAVEMAWENLRASFTVEADADREAWAEIDRALGGKPQAADYMAAALFADSTGERLGEALAWIDRALAMEQSVFAYDVKARILHKLHRTAEALKTVDVALAGAPGHYPRDLTWGLEQLRVELVRENRPR
ncbi:MAG TPA: DUF2911 domain-containing protein [Thermoanaerobaculia bacterium]|nr:DUF2911 domain-containing protein [Thermoanaerobaculia bacterium]